MRDLYLSEILYNIYASTTKLTHTEKNPIPSSLKKRVLHVCARNNYYLSPSLSLTFSLFYFILGKMWTIRRYPNIIRQ